MTKEQKFYKALKNAAKALQKFYMDCSGNKQSFFNLFKNNGYSEDLDFKFKDEIYIPYYQPKTNRIEKFKPDFIFWLKKKNDYIILFIDPKGTEHTDGYRKIDGYSKIFEEDINNQKQLKTFSYNGFSVTVKLFLKPKQDIAEVPENYRQYWFDNFVGFEEQIKASALTEKTR